MDTPARTPWTLHFANLARAAFWLLLVFILASQLFGGRGVDKERAARAICAHVVAFP